MELLGGAPFFFILFILFYALIFGIIFIVLRFTYKWMKKDTALKQEQNELLRELIRKSTTPM